MNKKVNKRVNSDGNISKLTSTENEVLHLLSKEFLTVKQIAIQRKTKSGAVYKILRSLRKKGVINKVNKIQCTLPFSHPNKIRLHGEEFNIKLLYKDNRYKKLLEKCNLLNIDGNTVRLYRNSIEIYSGQSFYADTPQKAVYNSIPYWNRFFTRLEHDLKVILIKSRYQNIKAVKIHFSEINNEIAKDYEVSGDKLRIYAKEDGKLWLTMDNSFNLHELETQHSETAKQDMNKVLKQVNDWRDHNPPTTTEIANISNEILQELKLLTTTQRVTTEHMKFAFDLLLPKKKGSLKQEKGDISYFG